MRLGGSEKADGNLTRLSTRSLSWSGGLEWARSRKKYWTRRSFDGALDSLNRVNEVNLCKRIDNTQHSFQYFDSSEFRSANLRKVVMRACNEGRWIAASSSGSLKVGQLVKNASPKDPKLGQFVGSANLKVGHQLRSDVIAEGVHHQPRTTVHAVAFRQPQPGRIVHFLLLIKKL